MKIRLSTRLDAPADAVWRTLRKTELLRYLAWPLLSFDTRGLPKVWPESGVTRIESLLLFGVVPLWSHEIRIVQFDDTPRSLLTEERGGPVEVWNHRIGVEPLSDGGCLYTDEVELRAGAMTLSIWLFACLFYRYRQARWRGLAPLLG